MNPSPELRRPRAKRTARGRWLGRIALAALLAGGGYWTWTQLRGDPLGAAARDSREPTFTVRRGPLAITVDESGTVQAKEQVVIKNEVEGQTTILFLIEEGKFVEKGDLLVQLDASELQLDRLERVSKLNTSEAAFIAAKEQVEVVRSQGESDVAKAELEHRFAIEDLKNYQAGEFPQLEREARSKITLALEELETATQTLTWSEKLYAEKYISQSELDQDRLAQSKAKLDHELAVAALDLLKQYTYERKLAELDSNVAQTDKALEREKRKAAADLVEAEAEHRSKEAEFKHDQERLKKVDEQIEKAHITAPSSGMVVYATTGKANMRGNEEPLREGVAARERQDLIHLPTANSMMAMVNVHEASLEKVKVGQPVTITMDALASREFKGTVSRIAPLPDATMSWLNPDLKVYPATINLEGNLDGIRTGMNCRASILVEQLEDVVYMPIQAVVRVGDQPTAYVRNATGAFEPRPVELGLDNNQMVHVKSGVAAGDVVSLAPPLSEGTRSAPRKTEPAAPGAPLAGGANGTGGTGSPAPADAGGDPSAKDGPSGDKGFNRDGGEHPRKPRSGKGRRPGGDKPEGAPPGSAGDGGVPPALTEDPGKGDGAAPPEPKDEPKPEAPAAAGSGRE